MNVRDSGAFSTYHALQVELRRRLSNGLSVNGSYQYALEEFTRFDIGLTKKIRMGATKNLELRADVLNVFNNINFTVSDPSRTSGSGAGIFQTDSAYRDLDNTYDPGGRLGQLAIRFNW